MFFAELYTVSFLIVSYSCEVLQLVLICPKESQWTERSKGSHCQNYEFYHCLKLHNGSLGEVCTEPRGIAAKSASIHHFWTLTSIFFNGENQTSVYDKRDDFGFNTVNFPWLDECPIYDAVQGKIETIQCVGEDLECPKNAYTSEMMYKYSACVSSDISSSPTPIQLSTQMETSQSPDMAMTRMNTRIQHDQLQETPCVKNKMILYVVLGIGSILAFLLIVNTSAVIINIKMRKKQQKTKDIQKSDAATNTEGRDSGIYNDIESSLDPTYLTTNNLTYSMHELKEEMSTYEEPVQKTYEWLDSEQVTINKEQEAAKQYEDIAKYKTGVPNLGGDQAKVEKCCFGKKRNSI